MANNDESCPPSPGGQGSGTGGTAGADIAGRRNFQAPQGNPPTVGTLTTPMFFQSVPLLKDHHCQSLWEFPWFLVQGSKIALVQNGLAL